MPLVSTSDEAASINQDLIDAAEPVIRMLLLDHDSLLIRSVDFSHGMEISESVLSVLPVLPVVLACPAGRGIQRPAPKSFRQIVGRVWMGV